MLYRVALVRPDVSEERSASIIKVNWEKLTNSGELSTTREAASYAATL
jgi:hypothetical protein